MDLSNWSWDPSLFYVVPAAVLYALGSRPKAGRPTALQAAAFYTGLLSLVIAVDSPIDAYSDELLWVHMLQHIILLTVAPPLILLGRPWPTMWRALPRRSRSAIAREVSGSPVAAPVRALAKPLAAWIVFNAAIVVWHIPSAYDLTERNGLVHAAEHAMFFFFGLLFWARVIDTGPLRPHLQWPARIAYIVGAMIVGWVLAIVFVVAPEPIYAALREPSDPSRRHQRAHRPAARGRDDVGGWLDRVHDRAADRALQVGRARAAPTRAGVG